MTDWIQHTGDTCPVPHGSMVQVVWWLNRKPSRPLLATTVNWRTGWVAYYRILTRPKPPEPEMTKTHEDYTGPAFGVPTKPEPDLIALRLECLKLALQESSGTDYQRTADIFLHYVLNGSKKEGA